MRPIAQDHGVSVAQVALAWLLQRAAITSVIVGAKSLDQLKDNIAAAALTLSASEIATLDEASKIPREYPGWMFDRQLADRLPVK
jgi:aryl-alcohol dehydrogenase-like predicted oxidoreductase